MSDDSEDHEDENNVSFQSDHIEQQKLQINSFSLENQFNVGKEIKFTHDSSDNLPETIAEFGPSVQEVILDLNKKAMAHLDLEFANSCNFADESWIQKSNFVSKFKKSEIDPDKEKMRAEGKVQVRKLTNLKSYEFLKQAERILME